MQRVIITDKLVTSLQPAPKGKRVEIADVVIPQFRIRVTDKGAKSYVLYRRWPGSKTPARRAIGGVDDISLSKARDKAREWLGQVADRIDPREKLREEELAEQKRRQHTFEIVAEDWLKFPDVKAQRKYDEVASAVRREFVGKWGKRPITSITRDEVADFISDKAADTPAQARNLLGYAKRLFQWAVDRRKYGIEISPASTLSAKALCGKKKKRKRWLRNEELRLYWRAALATPYPYGPLFRMLALTGQRESEVGEATWSEFNTRDRVWIIPAARMKMDEDHAVPLSDDMIALLQDLPRFNAGDCLFSTDNGVRPVNGYGKAKERIDALITELRKTDGLPGAMPHWVFHDIRRTMRTNLSALKITANVRERMIAHAQEEIEQHYDLYDYLEEKREGFDLWAARLRGIVEAKPAV
jgi:integrase